MTQFAWKTLSNTGLQENTYLESERHEIRGQFAHEPKRILDIGCSTGCVSAALKRDCSAFTWGVELNTHSAEQARQRLDKVTTHTIEEFTEHEIELLKTVDTVLLLDVLEHMYNPWSCLEFLAQHLQPDTQIVVSLPNVANGNVLRDLSSGYWHYKPTGLLDVTHVRFFTEYEMKKMFYETGYRVESSLYMGDYCVDQTLYENGPFPLWVDLGNVKIEVRDHTHWLQINTIQVISRFRIAHDEILTEEERVLRFESHPPTAAF